MRCRGTNRASSTWPASTASSSLSSRENRGTSLKTSGLQAIEKSSHTGEGVRLPRQLVECVPNFSEGRDAAVVDAIARAVLDVPEVVLLDRTSDFDHNRSVLTFAGPPGAVTEAAFRAVEQAVARIDLRRHAGEHPRIGAADVVPFVPVEGVTLSDCAELAVRTGGEIWHRLRVPVYLYEAAARRPERGRLENIRRGQFEALCSEMGSVPGRDPDIGDPVCHPSAGAVAVGARKFLIAWNINLSTGNLAIARSIARAIRQSSGRS